MKCRSCFRLFIGSIAQICAWLSLGVALSSAPAMAQTVTEEQAMKDAEAAFVKRLGVIANNAIFGRIRRLAPDDRQLVYSYARSAFFSIHSARSDGKLSPAEAVIVKSKTDDVYWEFLDGVTSLADFRMVAADYKLRLDDSVLGGQVTAAEAPALRTELASFNAAMPSSGTLTKAQVDTLRQKSYSFFVHLRDASINNIGTLRPPDYNAVPVRLLQKRVATLTVICAVLDAGLETTPETLQPLITRQEAVADDFVASTRRALLTTAKRDALLTNLRAINVDLNKLCSGRRTFPANGPFVFADSLGYRWMYGYTDGSGCSSCTPYSSTVVCNAATHGRKMKYHQPSTHNNDYVYSCMTAAEARAHIGVN